MAVSPPRPPLFFHLCSLHRGLINLTPGDGFPSQLRPEVMGIQSVTNVGASKELAPLGVQVVLHSPVTHTHTAPPKWPWRLGQDYFGGQVTDQVFHYPLVTLQFLWWDFFVFFYCPLTFFENVYTAFSPGLERSKNAFSNFLSALIKFILTRVLRLW